MSTPTGGGNGGGSMSTNLVLGVDTVDGIKNVDQLESKLMSSADTADKAGTKIQAAMENIATGTKQVRIHVKDLQGDWKAFEKGVYDVINAENAANEARKATEASGARYLAQLQKMNNEFGLSATALRTLHAEQLNVAQAAAPLIQSLHDMEEAARKSAIQQKRDIEMHREQVAAMNERARIQQQRDTEMHDSATREAQRIKDIQERRDKELYDAAVREAQRIKQIQQDRDTEIYNATVREAQRLQQIQQARDTEMYNEVVRQAQRLKEIQERRDTEAYESATREAQRIKEIQQRRDVEIHNARQKERADYEKWWAETIAAQEKHEDHLRQSAIAFNAFKIRTKQENAREEARIQEENRQKAIKAAEDQAMAEIRWAETSLKQRVAILDRLKQYQADPRITQQTIDNTFSRPSQADIGNLEKYRKELENMTKSHKSAHGEAKTVGEALDQISFKSARARSEIIVLAHEAVQGRFSRMPASMMVLAEYTNMASLAFSAAGVALITMGIAAGGALWQMGKGAFELAEFNKALALTGGYAGQTRDSIRNMAEELKGNAYGAIGTTTDMLEALVKTGKFSSETIEEVGRTALKFKMLTGQSTEQVAGFFEGLVKVHGKVFNDMQNHTADWAAAANEKYHFLSAAQYEHIRLLSHEGEQSEAIIEIMQRMGESFNDHDKHVGILVASYKGFVMIVQELAHWLQEVGKDWFVGESLEAKLEKERKSYEEAAKARFNYVQTMRARGETDGFIYNDKKLKQIDEEVRRQQKRFTEALAAVEAERLKTKQKGDLAIANQEGVTAQRHWDYQDKFFRTKKEKEEDEIQHAIDSAMRINKSNMLQWESEYKGKKENMQRDMELAIQNGELRVKKEEDILKMIANIKAKYAEKGPRQGNDGRKNKLMGELDDITTEYELVQQAVKDNLNLLKDSYKAGEITAEAYRATMMATLDEERQALDRQYESKIELLKSFNSKDANQREEIGKRLKETTNDYTKAVAAINNLRGQIGVGIDQDVNKQYKDMIKAVIEHDQKEGDALQKRIDARVKENAEIGKSAEQKALASAQLDDEIQKQAELDAAYLRRLLTETELDDKSRAAFTARLVGLERTIEKYKELDNVTRMGAALELQAEYDKEWEKTFKKIEDGLYSAIAEGGGKSLKKLVQQIKKEFAEMVLRPIIQPISQGMASIFNPKAAQAGGSAEDSNPISMVQTGLKALEVLKTGFASVGASVGSMVSGFGSMVGSSSISAFGAGMGMTSAQAAAAAEAYGAAGMSSTGSAISAGSTAGAAAGILAGIAGGHFGGRLVSGGYSAFGGSGNSAVNTGTAIGAAVGSIVPVIGTAVGALIGGLLGGATNRLFGYKEKEVTAMGMSGHISDESAGGQTYRRWLQKGGVFRDDKSGIEADPMTTEMKNTLSYALAEMKGITTAFGKNLGITKELGFYGKEFDIDFGKDGKGSEEALKKLFVDISNELASELVPNIAEFARNGETAAVTLERLSNTFKLTNDIATALGRNVEDLFGGKGMESAKNRDRVVAMAGGEQNLTSLMGSYANNFLTEEQRMAPMLKAVQSAMAELGLSSVDTIAEFKEVVDGIKLTTDEGAKLFINLMAISDAFATVYKVTEESNDSLKEIADERRSLQDEIDELSMNEQQLYDKRRNAINASNRSLFDELELLKKKKAIDDERKGLQDQLDELTMTEVELLNKKRNALYEVNREIFDNIQAILQQRKAIEDAKTHADALWTTLDGAMSVLEKIVQREKDKLREAHEAEMAVLDERIKSQTEAFNKAKSLSDKLNNAFDGLTNPLETNQPFKRALDELGSMLSSVRSGGMLDDSVLDGALKGVGNQSTKGYGSQADYLRDYFKASNTVGNLASVARAQMTAEERTLKTLEEQKELAQKAYEAQIKQYDDMLQKYRDQIDELKGQSTTLMSIDQGIKALTAAILNVQANPIANGGAAIANSYQTSLGRAPDAAGAAWWQQQLNNGVSQKDIDAAIANSPEAQIRNAYKEVLGRAGDDAGVNFWLNSGLSISDIKGYISASDEAKKLQGFAVGTNYVTEDMPAMIHEGERIMPKADNKALMSALSRAPSSNAEMIREFRAMRAELAGLRTENKAGMVALQRDTAMSASKLKRIETIGVITRAE